MQKNKKNLIYSIRYLLIFFKNSNLHHGVVFRNTIIDFFLLFFHLLLRFFNLPHISYLIILKIRKKGISVNNKLGCFFANLCCFPPK